MQSPNRIDPILRLPTEILKLIFENEPQVLTTCLHVNKAWNARLSDLRSMLPVTIDLRGLVFHESWIRVLLALFTPALTTIIIKMEELPGWLLLLIDAHCHRANIRDLEFIRSMNMNHQDSLFRFDLNGAPSTFGIMFSNLTILRIETDECPSIHVLLQMCPHLIILNCVGRTTSREPDFGDERDTVLKQHTNLRALQISQRSYPVRRPRNYLPYLPRLRVLRIVNSDTASNRGYSMDEFIPTALVDTPDIRSFYVGSENASNSALTAMVNQDDGIRGLQEVELEKRMIVLPERLEFFFERALRTVTRLYLGKLQYVRTIGRTRQGLQPLLELHIEASSSNRRTGNYDTDLSQLLSLAPNLIRPTVSGLATPTARHIMPTIGQLRHLRSVRMIDCSYDRTMNLTPLDISGLGALPDIEHIFISGIYVHGYDDFLSNLAESGGVETLETIQVALAGFTYIDRALQRLHDVCPKIQFADLDLAWN